MAADTQIVSSQIEDGNSDYVLPPNMGFRLKAVYAEFDDNGASATWAPAVVITSDSAHPIATAIDQDVTVAAGGSATTSFFPRGRRRVVGGGGPVLAYNLAEIAGTCGTGLSQVQQVAVTYQDIQAGDGILVFSAAPSVPSLGATPGHPQDVIDSQNNSYTALASFAFEANPPNVNEGLYVTVWFCPASKALMHPAPNQDVIEVDWDNNVFDRIVQVYAVHHDGGATTPLVLAATPDHDATAFAATEVTLTTGDFDPARDASLEFAWIVAAKAGGLGAFSGVGGYLGFFQALSRFYNTTRQNYLVNPQSFGANSYLIAGSGNPVYEDDVGTLPAGVDVPPFNGVGQHYSTGTNAWKGIILLGLD